jgi:hypothetical protein
MKLYLALIVYMGATAILCAADWQPSKSFLDAVCQIESSNGRYVYGDGGRSLGHFQIQKAAWTDVVAWRKRRGLAVHDYHRFVLNPEVSRIYAANYLTILHNQLKGLYQREPTPAEIYAAYNMGLTSFGKCNYNLSRINSMTRAKCRQVTSMLTEFVSSDSQISRFTEK